MIDELDPGIRRTVALIQSWGFRTSDSGDGRSKRGTPGEACMMPFPNVTIMLDGPHVATPADILADHLRAVGIDLGATHMDDGQEVPVVTIEATYLPIQRASMILLTGVDDAMLATLGAA